MEERKTYEVIVDRHRAISAEVCDKLLIADAVLFQQRFHLHLARANGWELPVKRFWQELWPFLPDNERNRVLRRLEQNLDVTLQDIVGDDLEDSSPLQAGDPPKTGDAAPQGLAEETAQQAGDTEDHCVRINLRK